MTESSIVKDGRLTVPLFHGTSSLFYDSILSTGLGGRDIVQDMGIRRAAQLLLDLSHTHRDDEDWLSDIDACKRIAADPSKDQLSERPIGFNFRYGGTYLSASSQTGARYALLYSAGGEALVYTLKLYQRVLAVMPGLATHDQFASLISFVARPARPLLVEASGVKLAPYEPNRAEAQKRSWRGWSGAFTKIQTFTTAGRLRITSSYFTPFPGVGFDFMKWSKFGNSMMKVGFETSSN